MIYFSNTYLSYDGIKIFSQGWKPDNKPEKVICMVHGIGEHSGRYASWAEKFIKAGIAFFTFDLRGHGKSEGKRGDAVNYDIFMQDIEQGITELKKVFPDIPVILYGQSMGGNLVLNYLLRKQPKIIGAIASSPWIELAFKVPPLKKLLANVVHKIMPGLIQPTGLKYEDLSRTKTVSEIYQKDPLVHNKISVRLYFSVNNAGKWLLGNTEKLKIPLLIMHGNSDRITSYKASAEFAEKTKQYSTLKIWDGLYHELHNEPERDEVAAFVLDWIKKLMC